MNIKIDEREIERVLYALHNGIGKYEGVTINYRDFIAALLERKIEIEQAHLEEIFKRFVDPVTVNDPGGPFITPVSVASMLRNVPIDTPDQKSKGFRLDDFDFGDIFDDFSGGSSRMDFDQFCAVAFHGKTKVRHKREEGSESIRSTAFNAPVPVSKRATLTTTTGAGG